ncbi:hypothetical protein NPIL_474311 [Nephila pilipes]|uniref:Uncharacterized protein n=1 Tax=Nephila pilipes TaxID=299642 RepID=A0A8X6TB47_NEPPI|nr:hypothetical protein NPIL_390871 [Nephila pilipes]GFT61338.1 hypothetical protein NPIL_353081 [Nephila pilipes]GFU51595.1 hypothetical protein NPIL_474311 [Nephila pilipes]
MEFSPRVVAGSDTKWKVSIERSKPAKGLHVHQPHKVRGERRSPRKLKEFSPRVVAGSDTKWKVSIERYGT